MLKIVPTGSVSMRKAISNVGNPRQTCERIYAIMLDFIERIKELKSDRKTVGNILCKFIFEVVLMFLLL